jgi:hypothetical protein
MKRILIILALFIPLMGIAARNSPIDNLFKKYAHKDGVVTLNIGYIGCKFISFDATFPMQKKKKLRCSKK